MMTSARLNILAWTLSTVTLVLAFIAWGNGLRWQLSGLSVYDLFPLFGLTAFSLMWGHYIMAAIRRYTGLDKAVLKHYFEVTSAVVLAALLLHPGLLIWQLWRDGFGLPPESYKAYVGAASLWLVMLGTISLAAFLAYELRRKFASRPWWQFVQYATDAAMIAVFYHALQLGGELAGGWYRTVWLFYGVSLLAALLYLYRPKFSHQSQKRSVQ